MRFLARLTAILAAFVLAAQPVAAQSILRDAEGEKLLQDMVDPLAVAAGLEPGAVEVVLIGDPSLNAFVAGGQRIYVHSGLINAAASAEEVQGVLAHELGHITGGHIIRQGEGMRAATNISILSALLGVAAALAGAGDAAMGVLMAGQQAALGKFLAYSRTEEASADAASVEYLTGAGMSGRGAVTFFKRLQNQEFRYGYRQDEEAGFFRTHPLTGDRIARLQAAFQVTPYWEKPADPAIQKRFERMRAKLYGYLADPKDTLNTYPLTMQTIPAHYARAYAFHKDAQVERALYETDALIEREPDNPYFLELRGQVLLESGRPDESLAPLREAVRLSGNQPMIAASLGHALIATEDKANFEEAERVLRASVARDRHNPFAWYQLGVVYAARGDVPRARLASAEQQVMSGRYAEALQSARAAERTLPHGSPDWIRAQDVAIEAQDALEQLDERR
ncbi:MAG TPA: M48 family metalloprotease [Alteraurantiacibacter sp.]